MSGTSNVHQVGSTDIPVPSTVTGLNVNVSYAALKNPSPLVLSDTTATQFPSGASGTIRVTNPAGNDLVAVGGLPGSGDDPYFLSGQVGVARGTLVMPGDYEDFQVTDSGLLSAIAQRNGDIITVQSLLSQTDYQTPTNDPAPNPASIEPFAIVKSNITAGQTQWALDGVITLLSNMQLDPTTINLTNVEISPSVTQLTVYIDPTNNQQIDINPNGKNFAMNTTYTITIPNTLPCVADTTGDLLQSPYTISFTTFTPATPTVTSVTPGSNATGVAIASIIQIVMGVPISGADVTTANVKLIKQSDLSTVTSTVALGSDNMTITLTPSAPLLYSNVYYVTIANLHNIVGVVMVPSPWDGSVQGPGLGLFTTTSVGAPPTPTVTSCSPGSNATGVAINTTVAITMNTAITPALATGSNVALIRQTDSAVIPCAAPVVSGGNTIITLTPSSPLTNGTAYFIQVQNQTNTNSVTQSPNPFYGDSRGGNIGLFTTLALPAPTVSSVTPGANAVGVAINTAITIVMSTPINSANVIPANVSLIRQSDSSSVTDSVSLNATDKKTITLTPTANLTADTIYYVIVQNQTDVTGTVAQTPSPWYGDSRNGNAGLFTTVTSPPAILSVTPGNNAGGVAINTTVAVVMDQPVLASDVTTAGNVYLVKNSDLSTVPSTVALGADGKTITLTPSANLLYSNLYYIVVQNIHGTPSAVLQSPNPYNPSGSGTPVLTSEYNIAKGSNQVSGSPTPPVGYNSYVNTSGYYAFGEIASVANGLCTGPVQKVIVAGVNSLASSGHVGIKIVSAAGATKYTFATPVSVGSGTTTNVTLTDTGNSYTMVPGDVLLVTWDQSSGSGGLAISENVATQGGTTSWNGSSFSSNSSIDLAAQVFCLAAPPPSGANAFTTAAPSYTQRYNVSQSSSPLTNSTGYGPASQGMCVETCTANGALGTFQYAIGVAYGVKASATNGLTTAPIAKVVIPSVAAFTVSSNGSINNTLPSGTIGIQIVSSTGVVKYTFLSTFPTTSTGWASLGTLSCSCGSGTISGYTNITLIDNANAYTMVTGDILLITWSGTGSNMIAISQNASGPYGSAVYKTSGGSFTAVSGTDVAMALYSSP